MADALASGASVRKDVGVQVPPRAPIRLRAWCGDSEFCRAEIDPKRLQEKLESR